MRNLFVALVVGSLVGAPVHAQVWQAQPGDVQTGAFVGGRMRVSLGGHAAAKPRAELTIAQSRLTISPNGPSRFVIGKGLAVGVTEGSRPTVTLAGIRADRALGFTRQGQVDAKNKLGLSTGAWVGIGLVSAVVIGVLLYSDYCDRKLSSVCGDSE